MPFDPQKPPIDIRIILAAAVCVVFTVAAIGAMIAYYVAVPDVW